MYNPTCQLVLQNRTVLQEFIIQCAHPLDIVILSTLTCCNVHRGPFQKSDIRKLLLDLGILNIPCCNLSGHYITNMKGSVMCN